MRSGSPRTLPGGQQRSRHRRAAQLLSVGSNGTWSGQVQPLWKVELVWTDYGDVEPEQYLDERRRLLPCVDYWFLRYGWRRVGTARDDEIPRRAMQSTRQ
jgi:hypothetical protein